jgi:Tfp pilus assembly protein FimV
MRSIERMYEEDRPMSATLTTQITTPTAPRRLTADSVRRRPAARSPRPAPVRLTRRGRLILVLTMMAVLVAVGLVLGHGSSQAAGRGNAAATSQTLTVRPGETLWSVAARIAPHSDPRLVVADIESRNHLGGVEVRAGQQLRVPRIG